MPKKINTDDFIKRSLSIHGNLYDYTESKYSGCQNPLKIKCKLCKTCFYQRPNDHHNGHGCPSCKKVKPYTTRSFVKAAISLHGDKFNYSKTIYRGNKKKLIIICKTHGEFKQVAASHIKGSGCKKCYDEFRAKNKRKIKFKDGRGKQLNTHSFILKSKNVHGNLYDYSLTDYVRWNIPVKIICVKHGEFNQIPHGHLSGQGCKKCVGFVSKKETDFLDYLKIPKENRQFFVDIGRYKVDGNRNDKIFEFLGDYWHGNLNVFNSTDIHPTIGKTYMDLNNETFSRFEVIKRKYKVYYIWESEWDVWKSGKVKTFPLKKY